LSVRNVLRLLRDGVRLSLLLRPRSIVLDAGFFSWFGLALLGISLDTLAHWPLVEAPRVLNGYGIQTALAAGVLRLAAAAVLVGIAERRPLFWAVAAWLEAAALLPSALVGASFVAARSSELPLIWIAWIVALAWTLLMLLRLAAFLRPRSWPRTFAAAVIAFAIQVAPWFWLDAQRMWVTDWESWSGEQEDAGDYREPGALASPEATFYDQPRQLDAALARIAEERPERIDLYALAFGGDASEDVFRNEVEYVERLMPQRFDARDRTLALLNHPESSAQRPLATATNLERALLGLGERMDRAQDILFVYLTSHGSEDHQFYVNQPPLPLDQVRPERLRAALDASGIRWRVIVVSACYSGGFIDALKDPHTLVLTAARADRTSFGCGADSEITWFGKAFLAEALNQTTDFIDAHARASAAISTWERDEKIEEASEPQIEIGAEIAAQLERWRVQFEPGPSLPFAPAATTGESDATSR
jgi:hypothetical protein